MPATTGRRFGHQRRLADDWVRVTRSTSRRREPTLRPLSWKSWVFGLVETTATDYSTSLDRGGPSLLQWAARATTATLAVAFFVVGLPWVRRQRGSGATSTSSP